MKKIFLVDGDNNINLGLRGIEMLPEDNYVMIFHSKAMEITKFQKKVSGCHAKVEFIESVRVGKNSVDFQITTELGFLSNYKDLEYAYIISCDKGYDAAIDYVKSRYSGKFKELERKESIFDCFQLAFLLKAKNKQELNNALIKEYGVDHGNLVYSHIKTLFGDSAREEAEPKTVEKAEKKVIEVQQKVQDKVEKVVAAVKKEAGPQHEVVSIEKELKKEKKAAKVQKKNSYGKRFEERPEEKPEAKSEEKPERKPEPKFEERPREKFEERAEAKQNDAQVPGKEPEMKEEKAPAEMLEGYNIPLRFGAVRTEEQNRSFYKNKDLRKKKSEPAAEEEKTQEQHMDDVVEVLQEARRFQENSSEVKRRDYSGQHNRRNYDRKNDFHREQRTERRGEKREGKVVPIKAEMKNAKNETAAKGEQARQAEASNKGEKKEVRTSVTEASVQVKKASGQSGSGFFGRIFSRKKK